LTGGDRSRAIEGLVWPVAELTDHRMARLIQIFLLLAALVLVPFAIWGEGLERSFSQAGAAEWLGRFGALAWAGAIVLLIGDLFLPIPATAVMAALGYLYGPIVGGLIGGVGFWLSGALAYALCRLFGRPIARRILGSEGLEDGERLFARLGGWLIVLSRWLPVFPEVVACMAGLSRMRVGAFALALACGSFPLAFAFAAVGHAGIEHPGLAIGLSALLPPLLWLAVRPQFRARQRADPT
jgi:uncharacterized membrane protein YdjX (TVP38/TMEM64 family)